MKPVNHCQSCGMPLDYPAICGTEADHSLSQEYCKYCYRDGEFTHPDWDLEDMRAHLMKRMDDEHMPEELVENLVTKLQQLKRWKARTGTAH
jgi:hypothetical protein